MHLLNVDLQDGKVTLIMVRGKIRLGYEASLRGKFEVREGGAVRASGSIAARMESEEGDVFEDGVLNVTSNAKVEGGIPAGEATALVKLAQGPIKAAVKVWEASLKKV